MVDRAGFLIVGIKGLEISPAERDLLKHPAIAGVILFKHNYVNKLQLKELIDALHDIKRGLIVTVDQECREVQVLKKDFTQLPMPIEIGNYYDKDIEASTKLAYAYGVVIGAEMRDINIDLSYTPVLDMAHFGGVIGGRAFHSNPEVVIALASNMITGLHNSGLPACGKHFPGHGSVAGDTHTDKVFDNRTMSEIEAHDLYPYTRLIKNAFLDVVMLSHVIYSAVSDQPASLSEYWIKSILREQLDFNGLVCTDALEMVGCGDVHPTLLKQALDAGCDLLMFCHPSVSSLEQLLADFSDAEIEHYNRLSSQHLAIIDTHIHNRVPLATKHYLTAVSAVEKFNSQSVNKH
ncbi:MAG: beta-N-acetylhexosaminidase [Chromatiales bacterium]|nr:beta-N-acetylhexosaminidase [Chromatiales bacterium]